MYIFLHTLYKKLTQYINNLNFIIIIGETGVETKLYNNITSNGY